MQIYYIGSPEIFGEGASAIHVARMCEAFSEIGHDVTLRIPISSVDEDRFFSFYGVKKSFKIEPSIGFKQGPLRHFFHGINSSIRTALLDKYDFIIFVLKRIFPPPPQFNLGGWVIRFISEIRTVRSEMNVPPSSRLPLTFSSTSELINNRVKKFEEFLLTLGRLSNIKLSENIPPEAIQVVIDEAVAALPVGDFINVAGERARGKRVVAADAECPDRSDPGQLAAVRRRAGGVVAGLAAA